MSSFTGSSYGAEEEESRIGQPRAEHTSGHTIAINSLEKWALAALAKLGHTASDLVTDSHEPNNELASLVMETVAGWYLENKTAGDAGVVSSDANALSRPPPAENQLKLRSWIRRHINEERAKYRLPILSKEWGSLLANGKANARMVSKMKMSRKKESGALFHSKKDLNPSPEDLTAMTLSAFLGDARVDADILDSVEAGMAIAVYMQTGARGEELKSMFIQSLGHEVLCHERAGLRFPCLKLTAFQTKTKEHHLNQFLAHSNPWRCGVGLLGVSFLLRVQMFGPPPFLMETNSSSWKLFGTKVSTLDRRLKSTFEIAGLRRQTNDPLTYLGRHHGSRMLQHNGGSAEGGAARRGHGNGTASYSYTECPLPDLLRLVGNDAHTPFCPAHLTPELYPLVDKVVDILFPHLTAEEAAMASRNSIVDNMPVGKSERVRAEEHLVDRERLLRAIRFVCRTALCCFTARPRTWAKWEILVDIRSLWARRGDANQRVYVSLASLECVCVCYARVPTLSSAYVNGCLPSVGRLHTLFKDSAEGIRAMDELANATRRFEDSEIAARAASPDMIGAAKITTLVETMLSKMATNQEQLISIVRTVSPVAGGVVCSPLQSSSSATEALPASEPLALAVSSPLHNVKAKRKRIPQEDVEPFTKWSTVQAALAYARETLVPREQEHGAAWRIITRDDGGQDRSRHKQWGNYKTMAIAVGIREKYHAETRDQATAHVQRCISSTSFTSYLKIIRAWMKEHLDADTDELANNTFA